MRKFNNVNELVNTLKPEYPVYCIRLQSIKRSIAKRILSLNFEKWWTVSACTSEIDTLREKYSNENDQEKLKFLDELNSHVMLIQKKYENS